MYTLPRAGNIPDNIAGYTTDIQKLISHISDRMHATTTAARDATKLKLMIFAIRLPPQAGHRPAATANRKERDSVHRATAIADACRVRRYSRLRRTGSG